MKCGYLEKVKGSSIIMALSLMIPINVYAIDAPDKEVRAMEEHWETVVNEPDPGKRKALMEDHRKLMSKYSTRKTPDHSGSMGDMHGHHREINIKNTVEMHSGMMDMMQ